MGNSIEIGKCTIMYFCISNKQSRHLCKNPSHVGQGQMCVGLWMHSINYQVGGIEFKDKCRHQDQSLILCLGIALEQCFQLHRYKTEKQMSQTSCWNMEAHSPQGRISFIYELYLWIFSVRNTGNDSFLIILLILVWTIGVILFFCLKSTEFMLQWQDAGLKIQMGSIIA